VTGPDAGLVPLPILLPLLAVGARFALGPRRVRAQRAATLLVVAADAAISVLLAAQADRDGPLVAQAGGFAAPLGVSLVVDRLSGLMLAVSNFVTLAVLVYSQSQRGADQDEGTPLAVYSPAYLLLAAGVSDTFAAGDLFNLYVGFEIMLASSYVLLTIGGTAERIRSGAVYVLVGIASSLLFTVAIAVAYAAAGTVNLAQLAERLGGLSPGVRLALDPLLTVVFATKAAVFPLSAWLPDAYPTAPAPVTAVFAGLLTKVGVYALIRAQTLLFPDGRLRGLLLAAAAASMLAGILGAVAQSDLKRLLSFTLVSHVGFLVMGIGIGGTGAIAGTLFYAVHHIVVQTSLFLATGLIERREGTGDVGRLAGLARGAPLLAALFFLPAVNLAGIPPLSGFLGKLALLRAAAADGGAGAYALFGAALLTSLLTLYVMARVWARAFWRDPLAARERTPERVVFSGGQPLTVVRSGGAAARSISGRPIETAGAYPPGMLAATVALVAAGLALTVAAGPVAGYMQRTAGELADRAVYISAVEHAAAQNGAGH
jgi:multicomponent Na+:H+ antiporter subunit D